MPWSSTSPRRSRSGRRSSAAGARITGSLRNGPPPSGAAIGTGSTTQASKTMRNTIGAAHRVVIKVGSSSLTSTAGGIEPARIEALVDALAAARLAGREVVLVSSGAIAAGLAPLTLKSRPRDLATQQAAASVGQGLLMGYYTQLFARHGIGVGQVLLTVDDV